MLLIKIILLNLCKNKQWLFLFCVGLILGNGSIPVLQLQIIDLYVSLISCGSHGYDNILPEIHPILLAFGPAFGKNVTKEVMNAASLHPLLCRFLGTNLVPNSGSFNVVRDLLAEEVPTAFGANTSATLTGLFLAISLVAVLIALFVNGFILTQANTMKCHSLKLPSHCARLTMLGTISCLMHKISSYKKKNN